MKADNDKQRVLKAYKLDPSEPKNILGWMNLRINLIEEDQGYLGIKRAIGQMNRAILVCLVVIANFTVRVWWYHDM